MPFFRVKIVSYNPDADFDLLGKVAPSVVWKLVESGHDFVIYNLPLTSPCERTIEKQRALSHDSLLEEFYECFEDQREYSRDELWDILRNSVDLAHAIVKANKKKTPRMVWFEQDAEDKEDYKYQHMALEKRYGSRVFLHNTMESICEELNVPFIDECSTPPTRPCTPEL